MVSWKIENCVDKNLVDVWCNTNKRRVLERTLKMLGRWVNENHRYTRPLSICLIVNSESASVRFYCERKANAKKGRPERATACMPSPVACTGTISLCWNWLWITSCRLDKCIADCVVFPILACRIVRRCTCWRTPKLSSYGLRWSLHHTLAIFKKLKQSWSGPVGNVWQILP